MTKFVLAQVSFCGLNFEENFNKALKVIKNYQNQNFDLIIFPEMFLTGYPIGNVLEKFPQIIDEQLNFLKKLAENTLNTSVLIGFVEKETKNTFYNSLALLQNGEIKQIIRKQNLLNGNNINDFQTIKINGTKIGIIHCETGYNDKNFDINSEKFENIKTFINAETPSVLVNCSASASRTNKEWYKNNFLRKIAENVNIPIVYVNTTGACEHLSFDGVSRVYNSFGEIIARAKSFEEDILEIDFKANKCRIEPILKGFEQKIFENNFDLNYENDLERTYFSLIQSIKSYFTQTGFKRAVLGLSGGLDSTICAVLLADAIGKENVYAISMPSEITSKESKNDAILLAQNLGINFLEIPIKSMFETTRGVFDNLFSQVEKNWQFRYKKSFTDDNIQARSRATILWGIANEFEACLPIATSDKSELYMGYATINGDMSGGFAPIADITKTKLFALAEWLNKNRKEKNAIPKNIIEKRPGAELAINPETNKPLLAEEALMPYEFMDEVIYRIEFLRQSIADMQQEKFLYEIKENISQEQKNVWLEKFFKRMSTAHFKWSLLPLSPIIDWVSINSKEYFQPIISSKIKY